MTVGINRYKADMRELFFVLFEQFKLGEILGKGPYEGWDDETAKTVLNETYRLAREVLGPLNASGDREGCRLENGRVKTPEGYIDAWKQMYEAGIKQLSVSKDFGGQGAPYSMHAATEELVSGANVSFAMYMGLTWGAAEVIAECGTEAQKKKYCTNMFGGTWGGTMCLTEPQAGSDVGAASTKAVKRPDGTYGITGTKIFISGGDSDLTENMVHLVLARVDGAPAGTKGLSLFIVPRVKVNADGSLGKPNDVQVASLEHKMGINSSATCVMSFGENGDCQGELVGTVEHQGMPQMFKMMNGARIAVGIQGLSVAASAYLNALEYAKDRKQGSHWTKWKDPKAARVAIIEHPDVRRMLLELKAHTEGIRSLVVKLTTHRDFAEIYRGKDDEKAAYHMGQVDLLTPLVKAYSSEEAYRLCALAIQVYGGAGFLKDWPVEQYARDSKIFTIYEGTTHIQSMDLVGRKLGQAGGANFQAYMGDISQFVEKHRGSKAFGKEIESLQGASEAVMQMAMGMLGWSQEPSKAVLVPLYSNRVLKAMSELSIAWLLLEGAIIAEAAAAKVSDAHPDKAFYAGKQAAALWYARNVLPGVEATAKLITAEDSSPVDLADQAFSSL